MRNGGSVRRCLLLLTLLLLPALSASAETVAAIGDASIARDLDAGTWSLTAAGATLQLRLTTSADFTVRLRCYDTVGGTSEIDQMARFVTVTSDIYPQLERWYGARAAEWQHAELAEYLRARAEDEQDEA